MSNDFRYPLYVNGCQYNANNRYIFFYAHVAFHHAITFINLTIKSLLQLAKKLGKIHSTSSFNTDMSYYIKSRFR